MADDKTGEAVTTVETKTYGNSKTSQKQASGAEKKGAYTHVVLLGGPTHGGSPLLMECFPKAKAHAALVEGERGGPRETDPATICKGKLYRANPEDESGPVVVESNALFASMREGGRGVKITGTKKVSTQSGTLLASRVHFQDERIPLLIPDGEDGWRQATESDAQRYFHTGKQGAAKQKTTVGIWRPGFIEWKLEFDVVLDLGFDLSIKTYLEVLEKAGRDAGLLSFRPGCNGCYGIFVVDEFVVKKYVPVAQPRVIQLEPQEITDLAAG